MPNWQETRIALVRAGQGKWHPQRRLGLSWFRSRITDFALWYVAEGDGWLRDRQQRIPLEHGTLLLLRPDGQYSAAHGPNKRVSISHIHFNFSDAAGRRLPHKAFSLPSHCRITSVLPEAIFTRVARLYRSGLLRDERAAHVQEVAGALIRALLHEMQFRQITRTDSEPDQLPSPRPLRMVDKLIDYTRIRYGTHPTVAEMARHLGMSTDHFIRRVKQETGKTPRVIMVELRMNEARHLLKHTRLSISDIALELGYDDLFAFSQQFKRQTGYSPRNYREMSTDNK